MNQSPPSRTFGSIFRERSFWTLLTINVAIVVYYFMHPTAFRTLIYIYWFQSVIIGFFTVLRLLLIKKVQPESMTMNDKPMDNSMKSKGCLALFFTIHYGLFHLVYFVFIVGIASGQPFDFSFFQIAVGAFFLDQLWNFIRMEQWDRTHAVNAGTIFFLPYARIIPMHLTILLPAFLGAWSQLGIFLILKTIADLVMSVVTTRTYGTPVYEDPTVLRTIK